MKKLLVFAVLLSMVFGMLPAEAATTNGEGYGKYVYAFKTSFENATFDWDCY